MSSSSTKYILPAELIDQVIHHLHDDLPSLRACCLTCRAWVRSARFHIFQNTVLSAERADALAVILEKSPTIFPFVRSLTINGHLDPRHERLDNYLDAVIPAIAPKLTRLKTLRVQRVNLNQHPEVLPALIHNFPTLQELCIVSVNFNRVSEFAALMVLHPFLECLDLEFVWLKSVTTESHRESVSHEYPASALPSRLRCIKLNRISLSLIDWMSFYYDVLPVHTLTQSSNIFIDDIPQMAKLLKTIGPSLEHLTFCIYQYIWESPDEEKMKLLSSNTGLRTLSFSQLVLSPYAESYAWLPILLSQVRSHYIEEISFVFIWNHVNEIESLDLQDVQTEPVFSRLKRVIFRWSGGVNPAEGSQAIRARMNELDGIGLLVFRRE
ncbi:hypothetical protein JB92DRAFT_2052298 [Gautieria morchelliformis]|nr:hypothetical protein JB92DRAFT_2052298 [Gautieria morchelliformis]